jgi:hypothetical protein
MSPNLVDTARWAILGPLAAATDYKNVGAPPGLGGGSFFLNIPVLIGIGFLLFAIKVPGFLDEIMGIKDPLGRGGLGMGLLFAGVAAPAAALKKAGDMGKSVEGLQKFGNQASRGSGAISRMVQRKGFDRGAPTQNPESGNWESQAVPKPGIWGGIVSKVMPNAGRTTSVTPDQRNAKIVQYMAQQTRDGKDVIDGNPSYAHLVAEVGPVSRDDFKNIAQGQKRVSVPTTPPTTPPGTDEKAAGDTADARKDRP